MPKFVFRLQSLLNIKKQIEDNIKNELGKAITRHEAEKLTLSNLFSERNGHIEAFNGLSKESVRIDRLRSHNAYIALLKTKIDKQKENVKQAALVVDKYREQLQKAMQERKMLEKLKERRFEAYLSEQSKEEQRFVDELTSYKHIGAKNGL